MYRRALSSPLSAPPRASAPGFLPLSLALAIFRSWLKIPHRYPSALPFIEYLGRCRHRFTTPVQHFLLHSETSSHSYENLSVLRSLLRRTKRIEPPAARSCGGGYSCVSFSQDYSVEVGGDPDTSRGRCPAIEVCSYLGGRGIRMRGILIAVLLTWCCCPVVKRPQ